MECRKFGSTVIVRVDKGEDLAEQLRLACEAQQVKLAAVSGIGAVSDVTLGVFDPVTQKYGEHRFQGFFEIVSLVGTVTTKDGAFYPHLHMSIAGAGCQVHGGHLLRAEIGLTGEIVLNCLDGTVEREAVPALGFNQMRFM